MIFSVTFEREIGRRDSCERTNHQGKATAAEHLTAVMGRNEEMYRVLGESDENGRG